ncbi:MAG: ion channel [Syntrophomonas sp.]
MLKHSRLLFGLLIGLLVYLVVDLFVALPMAIPISLLTITGGILLIIMAFGETQKSMSEITTYSVAGLFKYWIMSFISITIGYSNIYLGLVRENANSFVGLLDGMSSIYFSIVTFATVGYGDIYPASITAKFVVMSEIGVSVITLPIIIAASIAWIINQKQISGKRSKQEILSNAKSNIRRIK